MSIRRKVAAVATAALATTMTMTAASSATAAGHAPAAGRSGTTYIALKSGKTTLSIDPGTAQALTSNGISVTPASEARATSAGITFPIQGGLLTTKNLAGKVTHSGGLTFTAGGKDLTIRDFTIDTTKKSLTAYVEQVGNRVAVLDLNLTKAKITLTKKHLTVAKVKATLTSGAAGALNSYFNTTLFKGGLKVGTATISASVKLLHS